MSTYVFMPMPFVTWERGCALAAWRDRLRPRAADPIVAATIARIDRAIARLERAYGPSRFGGGT